MKPDYIVVANQPLTPDEVDTIKRLYAKWYQKKQGRQIIFRGRRFGLRNFVKVVKIEDMENK